MTSSAPRARPALRPATLAVTEEAALRTRVRVIVVGDVPHVVIDIVLEHEVFADHPGELLMHVCELFGRRFDAVSPPDDHRGRADLTFGDPADVIFVEPLGDS